MSGAYCVACGRLLASPDAHADCRSRNLDPPRFCARCGRRLDIQVLPTGYRASCRRCERIHPAHGARRG
ncbi:MAG: hypothetical protein M3O70_09445 [Actinomycetota bacterium]|nr:hypothetical protein [Actinomycetota bacterium]